MRRRAKPVKASIKGKRPPARKSPKTEDARGHDLAKRLAEAMKGKAEALERETATSEILRLIGTSPTDPQPIFEGIARSGVRLCGALGCAVFVVRGDMLHVAATHGIPADRVARFQSQFPVPLAAGRGQGGRPEVDAPHAVLERRIFHLADIENNPEASPEQVEMARLGGYRTRLMVPMVRGDKALGLIAITSRAATPFTAQQVGLLETFADQAVIAIENVRLFKELEARNRDLTEALDQQTATSEILRVISGSPTDVQPVFDTIVRNAVRLCDAIYGLVYQSDGEHVYLAAHHNFTPQQLGEWQQTFPRPISASGASMHAIRTGVVVRVADVETERDLPISEPGRAMLRSQNAHSVLIVPMFRQNEVIGSIMLTHRDVGAFTDAHVELLKTFADQAVIAIENVRLFTELQEKNRALTEAHAQVAEALEQQTATSDILRVISGSRTDVQPVFHAIVASAVRLLAAHTGALTRITGDQIALAALTSADDAGDAALRARFPQSLNSEDPHALVIRARVPLNVADAQTDPRWPEAARAYARVRGYRSAVVVPLLRHHEAIGSIGVNRRAPGGFTDDEIALLQTFADQAVIAIENARLLSELQARTAELTRSVEELQALGEVSQALSSTLDLETVLTTIVNRAVELAGADGGSIFEYDETAEEFLPRASNESQDVVAATQRTPLRKGEGAVGRLAVNREAIQIPDIASEGAYDSRARGALLRSGRHALLAVPLLSEQHIVGGLVISRNAAGAFPTQVVELLQTFATQSALAIQNARLFHEIEDKSRQLEAASRHKSEFLANMSHELRTPLNAIIGFSEVLAQGMFGAVNDKQAEYLRDILESGRHLLSLINDILDLSKIEAGRMELELTDFDLPQAIQNAITLVRERALRRGIALHHLIDDRVADIRADERKVKQVLLNLLSNAIKFTPEGGRIEVRAAPADGRVEVSVTDTGVGIAVGDLETVFEEFRQVGTADKKAEGTGLGLALSRKFIELHGGRIWVQSEVGHGSTFSFTLPVRPWPAR